MSFVQICTCESILEKEMLLSKLRAAGVEAECPNRSISRKYTDTTVDLSFGGYSTVMGGFKIYVNEAHEEAARDILQKFIADQKASEKDFKSGRTDLSRFYLFSVFSVFIPILSHLLGAYFLFKAVKNREVVFNMQFFFKAFPFIFTLLITLAIFLTSF